MKRFKKILVLNINRNVLEEKTWNKIEGLSDEIIFLEAGDFKIKQELKDIDCVLINFGTVFNKEMIDGLPNLKYIGVLATAYGKIDVKYANEKNIVVSNLEGYSTNAVAEFTIAAVLENIRGLEIGKKRVKNKNYSEEGINALEISNSNFGIVGLGNIGYRVAQLAKGFDANIFYSSRKDKKVGFAEHVDLETLVSKSDFISINLAQNTETENLFDENIFNLIKPGAVVINTSPMEIIDIDALKRRLEKKDIIFILDHSDEMKQGDIDGISVFENCIIYPPIAYITKEASDKKNEMFEDNISSFLRGAPQNVVN